MIDSLSVLASITLLATGAEFEPQPFRDRVEQTDGLQSWRGVHETLRGLALLYPDVTQLEVIGQSAEGRDLFALRIADDPADQARPAILLTAAHHANEVGTPEHVLDAAVTLLSHRDEEPFATWLAQMSLIVVPMVNPDGSEAFWEVDARLGRKNRRPAVHGQQRLGVDLNRNYPFHWHGPEGRFTSSDPDSRFYRGPAPASEPEVRSMISLAHRTRPVGMISYHEAATRLLVPYAIAGVRNPEPSAAWTVANRILDRLPHTFGRKRYRPGRTLYAVTGVEKDWYHHTFGTLAYLVELPYRRPRGERLVESVERSRGAWMALFERWLEGPSLSVRAVDAAGLPVEAVVELDEISTRAGERWTTDPKNGWFHYYLPAEGSYTVRLTTVDLEVAWPVRVEQGWTRVQVPMTPAWAVLAEAAQ